MDLTVIFGVQPPFAHKNRQKLQEKIIKDKIKLPTYLTSDAHTLLKGVSVPYTFLSFHAYGGIISRAPSILFC